LEQSQSKFENDCPLSDHNSLPLRTTLLTVALPSLFIHLSLRTSLLYLLFYILSVFCVKRSLRSLPQMRQKQTATRRPEEADVFFSRLTQYNSDPQKEAILRQQHEAVLGKYDILKLDFSHCAILYSMLFDGNATIKDLELHQSELVYFVQDQQMTQLEGKGMSSIAFFFLMLHDMIADWDTFPIDQHVQAAKENRTEIGEVIEAIAQARNLYLKLAKQEDEHVLYYHYKNNNKKLREETGYPLNAFLTDAKLVTGIQLFLRTPIAIQTMVPTQVVLPAPPTTTQTDEVGGPYWRSLMDQDEESIDSTVGHFTEEHQHILLRLCIFGK
jgi:hypothetical protein